MDFDLGKVLTILIPAAGAWGAAWLTNRRERRQFQLRQEAEQSHQLSVQSERLSAGWAEMTTQARDIIGRLQMETIDAKTRAAVAEEGKAEAERGRAKLERELAEVRSLYAAAQVALEDLRETTVKPGGRRKRDTSAE